MKHLKVFLLVFCMGFFAQAFAQKKATVYQTKLLPNEQWWGGLSRNGYKMPYDAKTIHEVDQWANNDENQSQPLLISSKGRYIWCEQAIKYSFNKGSLVVSSRAGTILSGTAGGSLKTAFEFVQKNYFPANGKIPDPLMFEMPQYNTWIELMYDQSEDRILKYANDLISNGYPPGVLMIDDNWQENYGVLNFSTKRFKDPKGMIKKLHDMGFKVMLWICPFISADSENFRYLSSKGLLLVKDQKGKPVDWTSNLQRKAAIIPWWNGHSALLDFTNPDAGRWFQSQLDNLVENFKVDGFKLDAGDGEFYANNVVSKFKASPNDHMMLFGKIGLKYPFNEYRVSFKMAGMPLVQRLRDKDHTWAEMQELIPGILSQGLMGYAYTCPDMIGGGQYTAFLDNAKVDEELVVRSAQIHALMPMMQFSVAPWRVLTKENNAICLNMAMLHTKMGAKIVELAKEASISGEPIARSMLYNYPDQNYGAIKDQFMLGSSILVAPIVEKNARKREVEFPKGIWKGEDGTIVNGPIKKEIQVPLERLPYFILQK